MEEPVPNIVFVKAKKKKERKTLQPTIQVLVSLVTAIVAVSGILLSYQTFLLNAEEKEAQREAIRSNRFTSAIEHLKDESLAIRMGALFELKKLGLEDEALQESIARILNPFICEGIENENLLHEVGRRNGSDEYWGLLEPNDDIFLACEITSLFFRSTGCTISLHNLQAEKRHLQGIDLSGAKLSNANLEGAWIDHANLEGADFHFANLEGAHLSYTNFQGADFRYTNLEEAELVDTNLKGVDFTIANLKGAILYADLQGATFHGTNLQGANLKLAENLTAEQLLENEHLSRARAKTLVDDTTLFDDDLRAEYDRLLVEKKFFPEDYDFS